MPLALSHGRFVPDTSEPPFALPARDLITHVVELPIPPSVNRLWRSGRGRVYTSAPYAAWQRQADLAALAQRVYRADRTIQGKFAAHIIVGVSRHDLDNIGSKALLDWAQSRELIVDDKNCEHLVVTRARRDPPERGCRLTLIELAS